MNRAIVDRYDFSDAYDWHRAGFSLQSIVATLPAGLGIRYREQLRRIFHERYGTESTSRKVNSLYRSLKADYPQLSLTQLRALSRNDDGYQYYSQSEMANISKFSDRLTHGSEASYLHSFHSGLAEGSRYEYDNHYHYCKSGLRLAQFNLLVKALVSCLSQAVALSVIDAVGLETMTSLFQSQVSDQEGKE